MIYTEIVQAKNESLIPIFHSGKAAHSKYDPEREAQNFLTQNDGILFAIIIGVGGGYHIESFLKRNPSCKIIALEKSLEDLNFLKEKIPCVKRIFENPNVIFCCAEDSSDLEKALANNYFPAYYGNLQIACLRSWADEEPDLYKSLIERINKCLKKISVDYSTQARFGGLWQKNFFCNLHTLKKMQEKACKPITIDASKKAAIIAAGPSLDKSIEKIKAEREKYFTIATDTGYKILSRHKIKVDAAVSIDPQYLSAEHFNAPFDKDTIFVLDLAANHSIAKFVYEKKGKLIFVNCGHPLIFFASAFCKNPFVKTNSGGGTVSIAALDFAIQAGFSEIEIFGADFGYSGGKPYAKGSYLDDLYCKKQRRVDNWQNAYTSLMFRSRLQANERGFLQNELMKSYQDSLEVFLGPNLTYSKEKIYECRIKDNQKNEKPRVFYPIDFDFLNFKKALEENLRTLEKEEKIMPQSALILPYTAFCLNKNAENKMSTKEAKKLALKTILLYNSKI